MFPPLTHAFCVWIILQIAGLVPSYNAIQNHVWLSYRSRLSQQIPTRVPCCSSFKPLGNHTVTIFQYPRTCVTMWCARFTLVPRCSLTRQSMTWRSYRIVLSTLARVWIQHVGWTTGACQFLGAASCPLWTSCASQTLLHAAASSRPEFIRQRMCTCLATSAHRNWMPQVWACLHKSIAVRPLRSEQPAYGVCLSW